MDPTLAIAASIGASVLVSAAAGIAPWFYLTKRIPLPAIPVQSLKAPEPKPDRRVRIVDLVTPGAPLVSGRTFEDIHFVGPAFVKIMGQSRIEFCALPDRRAIMTLADGMPIIGAVFFSDCIFRRCYFDGISFIATMDDVERMAPGFDPMTLERWRDIAHGSVSAPG